MNTLELNVRELSNNELKTIDGGIDPITITAAGVAAVTGVIGGIYLAGEKLGQAMYHWFN